MKNLSIKQPWTKIEFELKVKHVLELGFCNLF